MSEHLEIEFKTLLYEKEFRHLVNHFCLKDSDFFKQTNYYFDSPDEQLMKQQIGLRVRVLSTNAEITLKIPEKVGLLEINDRLSLNEAHDLIQLATFPTHGNVYNKLSELGITKDNLRLIGSLTTKRADIKLPQGLLALDESWYNKQHDFELELEVEDADRGKQDFLCLLDTLNIKEKPSPNKIQRMLLSAKEKH